MKNNSNKTFILVIILVILLCVIVSGGTIYYLKQNSNNNPNELPIPNEEESFTEEDLEEYLDYVPLNVVIPYNRHKYVVDNIDRKTLLSKALMNSSKEEWEYFTCDVKDNCPLEEFSYATIMYDIKDNVHLYSKISNNNANNLLRKKYNISLSDLDITLSTNKEELIPVGTLCFYSFDNGFVQSDCLGGNGESIVYIVDSYEVNDNELIIYSKVILYRLFEKSEDLYTGKEIPVDDRDNVSNYVLQHRDDFTSYKHTFKKNELGYYWYSTEVVEE